MGQKILLQHLFIDYLGGEMIPYTKHSIGPEEEQAVIEVLRSGWLTDGPKVEEFEQAFCGYIGCKHAVAVSSCTAALCLAARRKGKYEYTTSALTYVATVNAIELNEGTIVYFEDIDPETWLAFDVDVPVFYAGIPQTGGFFADAAHACGAKLNGYKVGAKETVCFSFHPAKNMTTAGGGMITTEDAEDAEWYRRARKHGIETNDYNQNQVQWGFNGYMNEIQAAIGIEQLKKLDNMNAKRAAIYNRYRQDLDGKVTFQKIPEGCEPSHHIIPVMVEERNQVLDFLHLNDIRSAIHYKPAPLMSYHLREHEKDSYPNAQQLWEHVLSLPCYPDLSEAEQDHVIKTIKEVT